MLRSKAPAIRKLLRDNPDGMTCRELFLELKDISNPDAISRSLRVMPDAYIDRWTKASRTRGQYEAVWCVVVPPPNCPRPNSKV